MSTHRRTPSVMASEFPPAVLRQIVNEVATLLKERRESVSVCETAAGGLISAALLSVPGASIYYKGGLTAYTLDFRMVYAGWTRDSIKDYRGPTPEIVTSLAKETRARLGSTYCIAESGTAGPTGGETPNRTPGYVALAVDAEKGTYTKEASTELDDRESNMLAFAVMALTLLKDVLEEKAHL